LIEESFDKPELNPQLAWLNEPENWSIDTTVRRLIVVPGAETDFWQKTHYGFTADSGHFLHVPVSGDFTMTVGIFFQPRHQYDQAGLMVRFSSQCWLKTSVEYEPEGASKLGVVATHGGFSDWSLQDFPRERRSVELRVRRMAADFLVDYREAPESDWSMIRMAHLAGVEQQDVLCGLYACSPKGAGFCAEFAYLRIVAGD
jgi:regulation of enolase protein 1 (concanavalin A-like superfamily)